MLTHVCKHPNSLEEKLGLALDNNKRLEEEVEQLRRENSELRQAKVAFDEELEANRARMRDLEIEHRVREAEHRKLLDKIVEEECSAPVYLTREQANTAVNGGKVGTWDVVGLEGGGDRTGGEQILQKPRSHPLLIPVEMNIPGEWNRRGAAAGARRD